MIRNHPSVFAVGRNYQIIVTVRSEAFVSIRVGNEVFVDDSNGILRSASPVHNIEVPGELLDREKKYTVIVKPIIKRLAYFTKTKDDIEYTYEFRPVPESNPKCYHIADAHNDSVRPVKAAKAYGDIDFLILNGDVPEDSGNAENFNTIFDIIADVTGGNIPVVFARGNHDLRGVMAEKFAEFAPAENGKTYFTFRLGSIWGVCLDCGEDKLDSCPEYGWSVACAQFRKKETKWLEAIAADGENEFAAPGVKTRLVVVHNPFTRRLEPPFDIEEDTYRYWAKVLGDKIKPDLMLCGHTHKIEVSGPGSVHDDYGQPCTVLVGSEVDKGKAYIGSGIEFLDGKAKVTFTNSDSETTGEAEIVY